MKYIGIDGGGTKTKFVLFDQDGKVLKTCSDRSVHILTQSSQECIHILQKNVEALDPLKEAYIVAGLAGYGNQADLRRRIEDICQKAFQDRAYDIYSDVYIAMMGALDAQEGIVVIAGTGSIAYSYLHGQTHRCGGWGYQLGDEGSAYWIGKELLKYYCQMVDGRKEKTILYDHVKAACHLQNDYDMITYRHHLMNERQNIAQLAQINFQLAKLQDRHALSIYQRSAHFLADLILTLSKDFSQPCLVSYIGGVFQAGDYILSPLSKLLDSKHTLIAPLHTPEYGAYLLGRQKIMKMKNFHFSSR